MHDPSTVAFEIKFPWGRHFHGKLYRSPFITVWHEDPLNFEGKCGCRDDDSCGWFRPPYTEAQRDRLRKLGASEFSTLWAKSAAMAEKKSYAYICNDPENCYDAIYWTWRAIKHQQRKGRGWKYGKPLSAAELDYIYSLATNPVDNLRMSFAGVKDAESCADWFMLVFRCWQSFNRPWYRHPRWHVWHWRLQVHPLQKLKRRLFTRCDHCRKPFGWNESPIGTWGGDKVWHSKCQNHMAMPKCEAAE